MGFGREFDPARFTTHGRTSLARARRLAGRPHAPSLRPSADTPTPSKSTLNFRPADERRAICSLRIPGHTARIPSSLPKESRSDSQWLGEKPHGKGATAPPSALSTTARRWISTTAFPAVPWQKTESSTEISGLHHNVLGGSSTSARRLRLRPGPGHLSRLPLLPEVKAPAL